MNRVSNKHIFVSIKPDSNFFQHRQCMNETRHLRADFQPLIRNMLAKILELWERQASQQGRNFRDKRSSWYDIFLRYRRFGFPLEKFCPLIWMQPEGFNQAQKEAFLTMLAENFQAVGYNELGYALDYFLDQGINS